MSRTLIITVLFLSISIRLCAQEPKLMLPIGHTYPILRAEFSPDDKRIATRSMDGRVLLWDSHKGSLLAKFEESSCVKFTPDGKKIVTAGDLTATIWDASSGIVLTELKGHKKGIVYLDISQDGRKIVTGSEDNTAKIWDATTGKLLAELTANNVTEFIAFSPDGEKIATASMDSTVKIWDASSGKLLIDIKLNTSETGFVKFSPDGKKIVTAYNGMAVYLPWPPGDNIVKIWDASTGLLLTELKGHNKHVLFAEFSPDGRKIVTGSEDNTAKIWDVATGKILLTLKEHKRFVQATHFSPDGKIIATASGDKTAKLWNTEDGALLADLKGHRNIVWDAKFSNDGKNITTLSSDNTARIWNVVTGKLSADLKGNVELVNSARFTPDGKKIITAAGSTADIWDIATGTISATLKGHNSEVSDAQSSPDGKTILTAAYYDNTASIWSTSNGNLLVKLTGHKERISAIQFTTDGKKILTTSYWDSTAKIWDAATGALLHNLTGLNSIIFFARFSPDGKKVLTVSSGRNPIATIWDANTGNPISELKRNGKGVITAAFSPDGKIILTASVDSTLNFWDAETGNHLSDLYNLKKPVISIEFSSDSRKFVTTYPYDSTVTIWDAATGAILDNLSVQNSYISSARFSPDGKKIISPTSDVIKLWDVATGNLLTTFSGHTSNIISMQISPDGKKIASTSFDGTIKLWDVEAMKLLYTLIKVDTSDYLAIDNDNHYDGTEAARKLLYFTCGTEVIELEQVKDQLWVPNLAERIMSGETINAQKLSDLNICNLTPVVETIEQTALQYRFQITPRLGGLGATIVNVNGIEVKRYTPQQLIQQKGNYQLAIDKKELQKFFVAGKENSIAVKSLTAKSSISSRSVAIHEKANEKSETLPNLYAMVVGVSDYKGETMDLKYAAKDAMDMGNALEASAKKLLNSDGKEHVFLTRIHTAAGRDKFPEKNTIKQAFAEIAARAQPNDILLVFFAGHGVTETEKKQFYFLTADASTNTVTGALKEVGISTDELTDWIRPQVMKAQKRILIFDACNSGQAIREMISVGKEGQNFVASRGDDNSNQVKAVEKLNERSGMFILSASASDQKAYEMGKYNQGALTYSLLKAIKEEPDILEDRKYLNLSRWFNAAERSVNEMARETGARQQPQIVSTTNFNIGVVDEEVRNKIVLPFEKPMFTRSDFRNTESRIDNLKLRSLVDKQLAELSADNASAPILYSPEYEGDNVYNISGDYTIKGNEITVSVILTRGGTELITKLEIKELQNNLADMSRKIITALLDRLKKSE